MSEAIGVDYSLERFTPLLGEAFEIGDAGSAIRAVLVEATDLREVQGAGRLSRQFSLVWRGPSDTRLEQRIYEVRHPALGTLDLFLVCLGPDAEGMRYEAVFT